MKRSAFTLVELLVVVVVIALLVALLLPAINAAREYARRNQCLSQQRSLAIAMITYDKENNGLPGYINQLGDPSVMPIRSWVVSILPMIGESKRYEILMKNYPNEQAQNEAVSQATVPLPALLCPSDKPEGDARLNYVVNCGPIAWTETTNNGLAPGDIAPHFTLFKDRRRSQPYDLTSINKKVEIGEIPDGTSNTILLTENVDAGVWQQGVAVAPDVLPTSSGTNTRDSDAVRNFGFIWGPQAVYAPNSPKPSGVSLFPRPSSKHPATVVAAFADGTARVINDSISLAEWLKAVCPDDEKAKLPKENGGLGLEF